jgi:hypothetical protein
MALALVVVPPALAIEEVLDDFAVLLGDLTAGSIAVSLIVRHYTPL